MALDTITREEFDRRLEASTERMRQQRLVLEAQAAELEDLIGRYALVLERLEAGAEPEGRLLGQRKDTLRALLTDLAERTSRAAASRAAASRAAASRAAASRAAASRAAASRAAASL